jgi:hypothetical protein
MIKILNTIFFILKPVDTTVLSTESIDQELMHSNTTSLDIIKSLFWITTAIFLAILISSL